MLALAPDRNWSWLKRCVVRLDQRAAESADRSLPPVLASQVIERGIRELQRLVRAPRSLRTAIDYRNWLMITILATVLLRLRNFTALSLDNHMVRRDGVWRIDIDGKETKTGRPHSTQIPTEVGQFLDQYLLHIRPVLAKNTTADALWLTWSGTPLASHTIYIAITELARREFGCHLNPHLFRHIFATTVSLADPGAIDGARAALGHSTRRTTQQHYNRATTITAARIHADILYGLRKRSVGATDRAKRSG
jgi:site-specific recombinase XerD